MSNVLHITSSIRDKESVSTALGDKLAKKLAELHGGAVTVRDLAANDIPFVDEDRFAAHLAPYADRSAQQVELAAYADSLIEELQEADVIVISSPIYNFSVPATLKAWADLVARSGTTFEYTQSGPQGLLKGKKAYLAVASGGTPVGSDMDFATPWLKFFLGFLGIETVDHVAADGIMGEGGEEKIAAAHAKADGLIV